MTTPNKLLRLVDNGTLLYTMRYALVVSMMSLVHVEQLNLTFCTVSSSSLRCKQAILFWSHHSPANYTTKRWTCALCKYLLSGFLNLCFTARLSNWKQILPDFSSPFRWAGRGRLMASYHWKLRMNGTMGSWPSLWPKHPKCLMNESGNWIVTSLARSCPEQCVQLP